MTSTDNALDLDAFDQQVIALADARIAEGAPALINALGIRLGPDLGKMKLQTGQSFQAYIKSRPALANRYDIVLVKENTPGLWPKGRAYEPVPTAFGQTPRRSRAPRYLHWFWAAFAEASDGRPRYFDPKERQIHFENPPQPTWVEIPAHLIRSGDEPLTVPEIHRRIEDWFRLTGLEPSGFLDLAAPATTAKSGRTVLDMLISSLTVKQMQGVTLPLDVVAELSKRHA